MHTDIPLSTSALTQLLQIKETYTAQKMKFCIMNYDLSFSQQDHVIPESKEML